jgi:tRNA G10  N-methylase Trm11
MSKPISVWASAQTDSRAQRRGRYVPGTTAHPARMLPALAATAIAGLTEPGDLVFDPMCGAGTTLIEAMHLGRAAVGVDIEPRWASPRMPATCPRRCHRTTSPRCGAG